MEARYQADSFRAYQNSSNDDYCRAGNIYSPAALAIIGELPLVNCSRYARCTGVLASKHHYCTDTRAREREGQAMIGRARPRFGIGNQFRWCRENRGLMRRERRASALARIEEPSP